MKKLLLLVIIFISVMQLHSQNWKLINRTEKYNYALDTGGYYATIWIDSAKFINSDSVYYLNKIIKKVRNGYINVNGCYLNDRSQFFLYRIKYSANGDALFVENNDQKYLIKPYAQLNEYWVFDTLRHDTAKVIDISSKLIFGNSDSVKIIKLSGNDTIIISKSFGIIRFPLFNADKQYINLIGIEGRNLGLIIPDFFDMFDFNIGDVFYYKYEKNARLYNLVTLKKITINNKLIQANTITYTAQYKSRSIEWDGIWPSTDTTYTQVENKSYVYENSNYVFLNKYNNQILDNGTNSTKYKPISILYNNIFQTYTKTYPYYPYCKDNNSDTIREYYNPMYCSNFFENFIFGSGVGLIRSADYQYLGGQYGVSQVENLLGCIKNGVTYGTIIDESVFLYYPECSEELSDFSLFPNPSNDYITIETYQSINDCTLKIFNINGQEIKEQKLTDKTTQIDVSILNSGLYFVKLTTDKMVVVKKIIKE